LPSFSSAQPFFPDGYDAAIRRAAALYWGDYPDWLSWKAQLYQESRLRPDAISPAGARGLAQFMPGTWQDAVQRLGYPHGVSPHDARYAIEAGAWYMARQRAAWRAPRAALDRQRLAQASYNAGLGHIVAAQQLCGGTNGYAEIIACLPAVTGRHSAETISYVRMIAHWRALMAAEGR
jgi:soluble lytic murein transglycosylase-like protein